MCADGPETVYLTAHMLCQNVDRQRQRISFACRCGAWGEQADAVCQSEAERLAVVVAPEDKGLPVDPRVHVPSWQVQKHLQAHLGVGGEVQFLAYSGSGSR